MIRRLNFLDWILAITFLGFVAITVYRYRTQDYFDLKGLIMAVIAIAAYSGYRTPKGQKDPYGFDKHPLAFFIFWLLVATFGLGIIWTFAFSDGVTERWHHGLSSAALVCLAALIYAWARSKQKKPNQPVETTRGTGP